MNNNLLLGSKFYKYDEFGDTAEVIRIYKFNDEEVKYYSDEDKNRKGKMTLKENLSRYLDTGFPILYINSFEESKIEKMIREIADRRTVATWSIASGYGEYSTANNEWLTPPNKDDYPMIDISTISNRCIKISPNENICNYLTKLITEENINIGVIFVEI